MAISLTDIAAGNGGLVITGFENNAQAGKTLSRLGDVNGDNIDDFVIGSPLADSGGSNRGQAYVVFGVDGGLPSTIALSNIVAGTGGFVIRGEANSNQAGFAVSSAGDINGDGFDDIAVGAPYTANGGASRGTSYIIFGSSASFAAGINLSAIAVGTGGFALTGVENSSFSGDALAAGDFNGDGFDDLLVTAPYTNGTGTDRGEAYIVYGTDQGFAASTPLTTIAAGTGGFVIRGNEDTSSFGYSADFVGDINGDGFDDLILGARRADAGGTDRGAAYVVFGSDADLSAGINIADIAAGNGGFAILGFENNARAAASVSPAGDVNGDGFADIVIGAPQTDVGGNNRGAAYVIYGTDQGFAATVNLTDIAAGNGGFAITGIENSAQAGFDVSAAGDVNGDGFDDVMIGAYLTDAGGTDRGAVYVVFGNQYGIPAATVDDLANGIGGFVINGLENSAQAGRAVSAAGDVNDDGFDDLLIGAPRTDAGGTDRGAVYVVYGSATIGNVVNDAPVNTVPGAQSVDQNADLAITGLGIADGDAYFGPLTTTLSVLHGTLTVASAGGAAVVGSGTAAVTLTGTVAQINTTLAAANNVVYRGTLDYYGAETLTFTTNDGGNTGSGGAQSDTDQVAITVVQLPNDAPVNTVPGAQNVDQDADLAITGLSIADADAASGSVTTTLSVLHGTLTIASAGGAAVAGSGTDTVTLTGTVAQINTTLAAADNVVYRGTSGYFGAETLTFATDDGGNTGAGGAQSDSDQVAITVNQLPNDAPVNTVPGAQTVDQDADLAITGLGIADADAASGSVTTTLSVLHGTLTVASAGGAAVAGSGTDTVTLTGTVAQINTTLAAADNVVYRGVSGYFGAETLIFATNDGGNTGAGGAQSDTDQVAITVNQLPNGAPVNTVPGAQTVDQNADLAIAGLAIADQDAASGSVTTTLSVLHGTLTLVSAGGAAVAGSGTDTVTLTGTVAEINTTLAAAGNVVYRGTLGYFGADTLTVVTNDGGNTGAGGAQSDTDQVAIAVNQLANVAPVNTVPGAQTTELNTDLVITGLAIADADAAGGTVTTTLSVLHGSLTVASAGGAAVAGSGTDTVTLTGTLAQINTTLSAAHNLVYRGALDYVGADTLTVTTNDGGNTGAGGALADTDHFTIDVQSGVVYGTPGTDTFTFDFRLVDATVTYVDDTIVVDGPSSHHVLSGFEIFAFTDGTVHNDDGYALVDDLFFYSHNHDLWTTNIDADEYYYRIGWSEGRDPNAFTHASRPDVGPYGENAPVYETSGRGGSSGGSSGGGGNSGGGGSSGGFPGRGNPGGGGGNSGDFGGKSGIPGRGGPSWDPDDGDHGDMPGRDAPSSGPSHSGGTFTKPNPYGSFLVHDGDEGHLFGANLLALHDHVNII